MRGLSNRVNYIEFGMELRSLLLQKGVNPDNGRIPREYVMQLLDHIIKNKQSVIFTSHIVYYENDSFSYDLEMEFHTNSAGFIYVFSDAADVLERRVRDTAFVDKNRPIDNLTIIEQHEELCRKITGDIARKIGSKFLSVYNKSGLESTNIELIEGFIKEVFEI
jgi:adenylate kinase